MTARYATMGRHAALLAAADRRARKHARDRDRDTILAVLGVVVVALTLCSLLGGCAVSQDAQDRSLYAGCNATATMCWGWRGDGPFVDDTGPLGMWITDELGRPDGWDAAPVQGDDIDELGCEAIDDPQTGGTVPARITATSDLITIDAAACGWSVPR